MAMNLTDSGSNMHSEEQQNPEQVAKFNITFRLYASTMKRKAYAILREGIFYHIMKQCGTDAR